MPFKVVCDMTITLQDGFTGARRGEALERGW